MPDVIGLADVSSKDTGRGSSLKTGGMRRTYNKGKKKMPKKCKAPRTWNARLKKCIIKKPKEKLVSGDRIKEFETNKDWYNQYKKERSK